MLSRFITPELGPFRDVIVHETNTALLSNIPSEHSKLAVLSTLLGDTVRSRLMRVIRDLLDFYDIRWLRIAVQSDPISILSPGIAVVSLCTQRFIKNADQFYVSVNGPESLRILTILEQFLIGQLKNPNPQFPSHHGELLLEFIRINGFIDLPSSQQTLEFSPNVANGMRIDYRALIDSLHISDDDRSRLVSMDAGNFDVTSYLVQHELIPPSHPAVRRRAWGALSNENAKIDLLNVVGLIVIALGAVTFKLHMVSKVSQLAVFFYAVTYIYEMLFPDIARYTKPSPRLVGSLSLAAGIAGLNQGTIIPSLLLIAVGLSSLSIFDDVVDYAIKSAGEFLVSIKDRLF